MLLLGKNNDLSVNFDDSIQLGENQMKNFQKSLSGGFYEIISGKIKTMNNGKKRCESKKEDHS